MKFTREVLVTLRTPEHPDLEQLDQVLNAFAKAYYAEHKDDSAGASWVEFIVDTQEDEDAAPRPAPRPACSPGKCLDPSKHLRRVK